MRKTSESVIIIVKMRVATLECAGKIVFLHNNLG